MKPGDSVKAFVQVGLMRKPKWLKGVLVGRNTVRIHDNTISLNPGAFDKMGTCRCRRGELRPQRHYNRCGQNCRRQPVVVPHRRILGLFAGMQTRNGMKW